jgi:hypothetical protein
METRPCHGLESQPTGTSGLQGAPSGAVRLRASGIDDFDFLRGAEFNGGGLETCLVDLKSQKCVDDGEDLQTESPLDASIPGIVLTRVHTGV